MGEVEFVRDLPVWNEANGISLKLYRWDGKLVAVSTVNLRMPSDPASGAIMSLAGLFGGYETSGEETGVFLAGPKKDDYCPKEFSELVMINGEDTLARAISAMERTSFKDAKKDAVRA